MPPEADPVILKDIGTPWRVKEIGDGGLAYLIPDAEPKTDVRKMTATVVVASEVEDRDGDVVLHSAIDWTDHRANPLACLIHNPKLIGGFAEDRETKAYTVREVPGTRKWVATTHFNAHTRLGEEAFRLVDEKIFRGASLGWPKSSMVCEKRVNANGWEGKLYKSVRPLEYSHLPDPSNPDCVISVVEKGFGGKRLSEPLLDLLTPLIPERPATVVSGWEREMADAVNKSYPEDTLNGGTGADTPADADQVPDQPAPDAASGPSDHKQTVDNAVADMMASIYMEFTNGAVDMKTALGKFKTLLETHGEVSDLNGDGEMDADDVEPDDLDLDEEADPEDLDPEPEDDAAPKGDEEEEAKKKAAKSYGFYDSLSPEMVKYMGKSYRFHKATLRRLERDTPVDRAKMKNVLCELVADAMLLHPVQKAIADGEIVVKSFDDEDDDFYRSLLPGLGQAGDRFTSAVG